MFSPAPKADLNNVLIVAEYGVLNGGERSLLAIVPQLHEFGWHLKALVPSESEFQTALEEQGVSTLPLIKNDISGHKRPLAGIREHLEEQFRAVQPSLVHCNSVSTSRWCGPVTSTLGIPALGYLRDILRLSRQAIADINQLDRLIAVSQATRDWHREQGLDANKVEIINNGVDLDLFAPAQGLADPIRSELNCADSDPIVLFVGQIGMRKGVDLLIESFEIIAQEIPNVQLLIVGERNSLKDEAIAFEQQVRRASSESVATNRIHWLGRRNDVPAIMRQSDLLIHPARQEPLGRVLLEAAASGLPMVASQVGGSPEILASMKDVELIQPLEPVRIAERSLQLLSQPRQRAIISTRLRRLAETRFSASRCALAVHQSYLHTLDRFA